MSKRQIEPIVGDKVVPNILLAHRFLSFEVVQILNKTRTSLPVKEGARVVGIADKFAQV